MCILSQLLRWNNGLFLCFQKEQLEVKESRGRSSSGMTEDEVFSKVASLFKGQEDLLAEFGQFLPDAKRSLVSIFHFFLRMLPVHGHYVWSVDFQCHLCCYIELSVLCPFSSLAAPWQGKTNWRGQRMRIWANIARRDQGPCCCRTWRHCSRFGLNHTFICLSIFLEDLYCMWLVMVWLF